MEYNKDLLSTFINSMWRIIAGPVLLVAIPYFLTPMEQGYWYTFTGIAALSVFADLGFTTIVLQFSAHEFAFLHFADQRRIEGDADHLWRLASFFRFVVRWLCRVIAVVFPLIMIGGYFFLDSKHDALPWQFAWFLYSGASVVAFFNSAIMSFFEGCNSVALMQSVRFRVSVCAVSTNFIALFCHFDLYALSLSLLVNAIAGTAFILYYYRRTIRQLWEISRSRCYDWWPEFSSLIWRYAISWCSGYFIFQLFTPVAFHFYGAEFSGKIGISVAMWTAGFSIANTWIVAIIPRINMLVSERKWLELDALFKKNLYKSMATMILGGLAYFAVYYLLKDSFSFFQRILDPFSMMLLYFSWIMQVWINAIAVYLRAHKKEPLMAVSAFSGIYVAVTTLLCAKFLSPEYLFLGFLTQFVYEVPVVYHIYKKYRQAHTHMPA